MYVASCECVSDNYVVMENFSMSEVFQESPKTETKENETTRMQCLHRCVIVKYEEDEQKEE